jgi:zinc transport system substrate-binding protein
MPHELKRLRRLIAGRILPLAVFLALMTTGLSAVAAGETPAGNTARINAFVSILPQAYFVERIGGDHVTVSDLVGPGQSPATYEPTPKQIAGLSDANVYFTIGVPFETRLLEKLTHLIPNLNIVPTQKDIPLRYFRSGDDAHGHKKGAPDPHIWLDPELAKMQAETICDALKSLDPIHSDEYDANLQSFRHDLDSVSTAIAELLAPIKGSRFYVFHPSYGYFADRYGLIQVAIESEGKEPGARQLTTLIAFAKAEEIKAIFIQPQFAETMAKAIARDVDVPVVQLDPLARDYLSNLMDMAQKIDRALGGGE